MPTGYTAGIANGMDLYSFVQGCAAAFIGEDRGDQGNDAYQEFIELTKEYNRLLSLNTSQQEFFAENKRKSEVESLQNIFNDKVELLRKYQDMRQKVLDCRLPNADYDELKKFMLNQIDTSIQFDCDTNSYLNMINDWSTYTWQTIYKRAVESVESDMNYYKLHAEQLATTYNKKQNWVDLLMSSLGT